MDCLVKYMTVISAFALSSISTRGFSDERPFENSALELPYRDNLKPVYNLIKQDIRVAELLGIEPIKGHQVAQNHQACKDCIAFDDPITPLNDKAIAFKQPNESIYLGKWLSANSQIFIRDEAVAQWRQDELALKSIAYGETEIFLVDGDQMTIAKVRVGSDLSIDENLVKVTQNVSIGTDKGLARISQPYEPKSVAPSVRDSLEAPNVLDDGMVKVSKDTQELVFKTIAIQLVNEFSEKYDRHAISGVEISLVGSSFKGVSDARGIVEIADIPAGSRFFAKIHDPHGRIRNQLIEIASEPSPQGELFVIKTLRDHIFNVYERVLDVPQLPQLSSMCMRIMSDDGVFSLEGVEVRIKNNIPDRFIEDDGISYPVEVGPIYFNDFVPVTNANSTFENGRFCYLNLYPGLLELDFYSEGEFRSSASIPVGIASHLEDDIYLTNGRENVTRTVALPNVTEIVYLDVENEAKYRHVDYLDIQTPEGDEFSYLAPGLLRLEPGYTFYRGRLYGLAQSGDFEDSLFFFDQITNRDSGAGFEVLTLLQRGFVEDLFNVLYLEDGSPGIAFDYELGKVFVSHGVAPGVNPESLNFRLVDQFGREVQQAWFFGTGEDGFVKLMYFNIPAGIYTLVVETESNHWLDVSTVPVEDGLTSIVQTGNSMIMGSSGNL